MRSISHYVAIKHYFKRDLTKNFKRDRKKFLMSTTKAGKRFLSPREKKNMESPIPKCTACFIMHNIDFVCASPIPRRTEQLVVV